MGELGGYLNAPAMGSYLYKYAPSVPHPVPGLRHIAKLIRQIAESTFIVACHATRGPYSLLKGALKGAL